MRLLLQPILEWLIKKALILLGIIVLLVLGLWIKSDWGNLSDILERMNELENRIVSGESTVAEKKRALDTAIQKGAVALKKLNSLDDLAEKAEANFHEVDSETSWWEVLWVTEQGTKRKAAKEVAETARAAADHFKTAHTDAEASALNDELTKAQQDLTRLRSEKDGLNNSNLPFLQRILLWGREVLPTAFGLLFLIVATPFLLRTIIYYGIAPLVEKLPPVRIINREPESAPGFKPSAVSAEITIQPGEELLVHADFLQGLSQDAVKKTRPFLNWRIPVSSALSKMILLTSVTPAGKESTQVIISSTKDALGEVGILTLPEGSTIVMQPRALAGVVKPISGPIRISSEWRIGNLHSWLTLQLRYLVFHGPCQLIVKGCRGVKVEALDGAPSRLIDQSATLGFSAHLDYSNTRCETFIPYLRGQRDLFKDLFAGHKGVFLCEEMPNRGDSARGGRVIESFFEGILKIFGL
jgi:hypothetical protein